ncbi:kinase-like domain-containing protein [Naematelia encephala]|uniref:non-specific serine/threonine protein kinase n=1 Tax=Naematelia encephala TaxID=71784 RepID=A0A1Y2AX82_9TREE|nr:kinase-like domain-containing protein [Naematelia encephala]
MVSHHEATSINEPSLAAQLVSGSSSLPVPTPHAGMSPTPLNRQDSQRSGLVPSPRLDSVMLPPAAPSSSASTSKSGSSAPTPKVLSRGSSLRGRLSRRESARSKAKEDEIVTRRESVRRKAKEDEKTSVSESGSTEVIETPQVRLERDPETGRKMINQYLVLHELGSGTHGRVRLGRDMSAELSGDEGAQSGVAYYAIKIVDRNPKRKRLAGLGRQRGKDGGKMVNENEIRKEIAIFRKVNHPNVVRMKEIIDDPESSKLFMILEYCEGGDIHWKLDEGVPALTVAETRKIFRDTLLGLEYLHHQGIIHRDIKPSNLLWANDTVKISDFGCSHYSEALRVASAQAGPDGEAYVDDVELAKTAGSPAFFAPEMCYSGVDDVESVNSLSPAQELPAFTLRPPSVGEEIQETRASRSDPLVHGAQSFPLKPTRSNESAFSRRPPSARLLSSVVVRKERLPITNAIDIWALGVTLYCLLFGKTPFDAPNEYLLMQVIPTAEIDIPPFMGSDMVPTGRDGIMIESEEAREGLDLLRRLLEKDPTQRITVEQAKKHPFTLRGLPDPGAWLASTDPHAQTFVTVSNDEVAAVVIKSSSFREKFRKGIRTISHKLQIFGASGRSRGRSVGEGDNPSLSESSMASLVGTPQAKTIKTIPSRNPSPITSPTPSSSISRRFSILGSKNLDANASPRWQTIQLASPPFPSSSALVSPDMPAAAPQGATNRNFVVHRTASTHLAPPTTNPALTMMPVVDDQPKPPRQMTSSSSLDKLRAAGDGSPSNSLNRRQQSDGGRQRSPSSSSSNGIGSKLVRLLSRTSSQHSRFPRRDGGETVALPLPVQRSFSLDGEAMPRRSTETLDSSSNSSSHGIGPSPDRGLGLPAWETRLREPLRRGSNLSEDYTLEQEEIDWNETLSDDDDDDVSSAQALPRATSDWRDRGDLLGLNADATRSASVASTLDPIPDTSPHSPIQLSPRSPAVRSSPPSPSVGNSLFRSSSRTSNRISHSPLRPVFRPEGVSPDERAGIPGRLEGSLISPSGDDDPDDEGLVVGGSRRGRKGSMLSRRVLMEEEP